MTKNCSLKDSPVEEIGLGLESKSYQINFIIQINRRLEEASTTDFKSTLSITIMKCVSLALIALPLVGGYKVSHKAHKKLRVGDDPACECVDHGTGRLRFGFKFMVCVGY